MRLGRVAFELVDEFLLLLSEEREVVGGHRAEGREWCGGGCVREHEAGGKVQGEEKWKNSHLEDIRRDVL